MEIRVGRPSLVVLVGTTGAGKSTFARRAFRASEVLSSDAMRGVVADDENDQAATDDAFDALHYLAGIRLRSGRLTVIDATNVHPETRLEWVALARRHRVPAIAIVFDIAPRICRERNLARRDRRVDPRVLTGQRAALTSSFRTLGTEGFAEVYVLRGPEEGERATVDSGVRDPSSIPRSRSHRRS